MSAQERVHRNIPLLLAMFAGAATLVLAFIGYQLAGNYRLDLSSEGWNGFSELLFNSVRLLLMDSPGSTPENAWYATARIMAVLFVTLGIWGIIKELGKSTRYTLRQAWFRLLRIFNRKPIVIIGLGRIGLSLVNDLLRKESPARPVYAVSNLDIPENLETAFKKGALTLAADATDVDILSQKNIKDYIKDSSEIFIATGNDSRNLEIAANIKKILLDEENGGDDSSSLQCYVHVSDAGLTTSMNNHKLFEEHNLNIIYHYFSSPNMTARAFFTNLFLDQGAGLIKGSSEEKDSEPSFNIPDDNEVFHLFIFGFGEVGQALALHTARFAHFKSHFRPRLTIFVDSEDGDTNWRKFLARYPYYSRNGIDLAKPGYTDDWNNGSKATGSEPDPETNHTVSSEKELLNLLQNHAVKYAVNAEFKPVISDVESQNVLDCINKRLTCNDPDVKAAVAFCYDNERRNFDHALRLQYELSRNLIKKDPTKESLLQCEAGFTEKQLPIPIYAHLPVDKGLADLIESDLRNTGNDKVIEITNQKFPVHTFGSQDAIFSYDVIRNSELKYYADSLGEIYKVTSSNSSAHPDFEDSNMNAAMLTEIKLKALDICFEKDKNEEPAIFDDYFGSSFKELYAELQTYDKSDGPNSEIDRLKLSIDDIIRVRAESEDKKRLIDRELFFNRIKVTKLKSIEEKKDDLKSELNEKEVDREDAIRKLTGFLDEELRKFKNNPRIITTGEKVVKSAVEENSAINEKAKKLKDKYEFDATERAEKIIDELADYATGLIENQIFNRAAYNIIDSFEGYLKKYGVEKVDPDLHAKIEHNRWMGERLTKKWSFGERDDFRKQRISFVPWEYLPHTDKIESSGDFEMNDYRLYDRQMLPKIIMDQRERGEMEIEDYGKTERKMYAYVNKPPIT
jgi:hypothetical protein